MTRYDEILEGLPEDLTEADLVIDRVGFVAVGFMRSAVVRRVEHGVERPTRHHQPSSQPQRRDLAAATSS
jgi:hypothetical protein